MSETHFILLSVFIIFAGRNNNKRKEQMNMRHHLSLIFVAAALALAGCDKEKFEPNTGNSNQGNTFAKYGMEHYYLWSSQISSKLSRFDSTTDPFQTVLDVRYKSGQEEDKWTQLYSDASVFTSSVNGVEQTFGYDLQGYYFSNSEEIFFIVNYVFAGSPADKADIRRGDIILRVNGKNITDDNYTDVYNGIDGLNGNTVNLTMGTVSTDGNSKTIVENGKTISLTSVTMYENPILVDSIYEIGSKKIGYLAYASFDGNVELLKKSCIRFKNAGVKELVLDLRYNGGGYVYTETALASMLAPSEAVSGKEVYQTSIYNDELTNLYQKENQDDALITRFTTSHQMVSGGLVSDISTAGANIGIEHLYVLTTAGTASASESLIVGLSPYLDITVIGERTHGKFCSGILLLPSDVFASPSSAISKWGLYVMVSSFADRNGQNRCRPNGITPDVSMEDDPFDGYQLGDIHEAMLAKALGMIVPTASGSHAMRTASHAKPALKALPRRQDVRFGKRILMEKPAALLQ